MDAKSQEIFDEIIKIDQAGLSEDQKAFLMARRSYLNDEQRKRYADLIKSHEKGELLAPKKGQEIALGDMNLKQIKEEAARREVDITGLKTTKEILAAIEDAEQE